MTKDAPAFELSVILDNAARLAAELGVKVRVSRAGGITIDPPIAEGHRATSTERVKRFRMKRGNAGNGETHETHETHETLGNVSPPPPPSPPFPRPLPPTPTPAPVHTHSACVREDGLWPDPSEYPTVETVKAWAVAVMAPPECAEKWHAERCVEGWVTKGGRPMTADAGPLRNLFSAYATAWKANASKVPTGRPPPPPKKPTEKSDVNPHRMRDL
jgi:hypothetical protein